MNYYVQSSTVILYSRHLHILKTNRRQVVNEKISILNYRLNINIKRIPYECSTKAPKKPVSMLKKEKKKKKKDCAS